MRKVKFDFKAEKSADAFSDNDNPDENALLSSVNSTKIGSVLIVCCWKKKAAGVESPPLFDCTHYTLISKSFKLQTDFVIPASIAGVHLMLE